MEMNILPSFAKYLDKLVHALVPPGVYYVLTISGYGSLNGMEWLQECSGNGSEVIPPPANTSHFCNFLTKWLPKR